MKAHGPGPRDSPRVTLSAWPLQMSMVPGPFKDGAAEETESGVEVPRGQLQKGRCWGSARGFLLQMALSCFLSRLVARPPRALAVCPEEAGREVESQGSEPTDLICP